MGILVLSDYLVWCMLRAITETWNSVKSYAEMRPDFRLRSHINRTLLKHRQSMPADVWFEHFWQQRGMALPVVRFVYKHLSQYSGLWWDRILPADRLHEDLHLSLVCWFDWELTLLEDLSRELEIAIDDPESWVEQLAEATTVEEFLGLINQRVVQA